MSFNFTDFTVFALLVMGFYFTLAHPIAMLIIMALLVIENYINPS